MRQVSEHTERFGPFVCRGRTMKYTLASCGIPILTAAVFVTGAHASGENPACQDAYEAATGVKLADILLYTLFSRPAHLP